METAVISVGPSFVRKRDGKTKQPFEIQKIERAVRKAWESVETVDDELLAKIVGYVSAGLVLDEANVEQIQDAVELALMKHQKYEVAKAYIVYRHERTEKRQVRRTPDGNAIADYIHPAKYGKYLPDKQRREVFEETVDRSKNMHLRRFAGLGLDSEIEWAFDLVKQKKLLPSMRSMQFGGAAIEKVNCRIYNCCATLINRPRAFAEALYLLLCGAGVGYSIQYEHVDQLPALKFVDKDQVVHHEIADTIEGWADALDELINSHIYGYYVEFSYQKIRAKGSPLRTSGGRAPGHIGLRTSLEAIRQILDDAAGRKLLPIEAHDILCWAAEAVLSGGVRRSSLIALFSIEDSQMMNCKTGRWYKTHPWRANANNSAVLIPGRVREDQFKRIFNQTRAFGEPGFIFAQEVDYVFNPCSEIGLFPQLTVTQDVLDELKKRDIPHSAKLGQKLTGFAFCNLTTMNAALFKSLDDFMEAAKAATLIGTMQASYTDMPYLGWVSEFIARRDALLGVSMTGVMDAPEIALNPAYQQMVAHKVVEWNKHYASILGINQAARTTTIKPEGTSSLALRCVGSGHHAHHARRYIRRVTANTTEPVFQYFKSVNPHMCIKKPNNDYVIEFAVEAPPSAILKDDLNAIEFLEKVKSTQINWVNPGTARPEVAPGLRHNVSNTVQVKEHEWDGVADYLWVNRDHFAGVSLLPSTGDKIYQFAPLEAVTTDADEARYNEIIAKYRPVDYTKMVEESDGTDLTGEIACGAGGCEVK